ncbi:tRNA-uridine aminocarboxypropyltransferase [Roseateles chitosanitabidus]|uniref:tRNA-uridine aminocarboxypropyltransferase n=1 Tax=Roseateles chitosanitabidus TaxID=65048 RepID=UPI00082F00BF|nr:tRNA-uridine aminocarboxypropyltransferase [Roseateles chitosanitabidus]MBO9689348.1 DTW domain-containing protein [Roseateles chitosanitabidus]
MPAPPGGRRPVCDGCRRPLAGCWCGCIHRVDNFTRLLILQDPDEQGQAKGTAALLRACLTQAELRVGRHFDSPVDLDRHVLLYPDTPGDGKVAAPSPWPPARIAPLSLVVLDGTWRRSLRLLHQNPWLQTLPRLALAAPPASRYAIRRARSEHQRSTLEASALALAQLDGDAVRYEPLWRAMDDFIALQRRLAGASADTRRDVAR